MQCILKRSAFRRSLITAWLVAVLVPAVSIAAREPRATAQDGCRYFELTGHETCGELLAFWDANGGLPIFGYPLTAAGEELNADTGEMHLTQYYERERLELHPENERPYDVLLGRLGVQILELTGRDWQQFPRMGTDEEHYFPETGFAIAPEFWNYWSGHGLEYGDPGYSFRESLLLFGFPISPPQMETNSSGDTVLTQWFERARFEYHPDNAPEYQVLLGLLGAEVLELTGRPAGKLPVSLELVAGNLTSPLMVTEAPDGSGRLFIVDQTGQIRIVMPDGTLLDQPFIDIGDLMVELSDGVDERGLLGMAFHPNYVENGRFFVYYSAPLREGAPEGWSHTNVVSEFRVSASDRNLADRGSERQLMAVDWPFPNHNSGSVVFGLDGFLYISMGDGGNYADLGRGHAEDWYAFNEGGNGQDIVENPLGSILRIDVDADDAGAYGIPPDNPFIDGPGLDEIYAYGFRNPYRIAFDIGGEHRLFAGDAGQQLWEEVSVVIRGGNYGWNVYEGSHCFNAAQPGSIPEECPDGVGPGHPDEGAPILPPVIEFANANQSGGLGLTVVGGYVYRGGDITELEGRYIFGVWSTGRQGESYMPGRIFASVEREAGLWTFQELAISNMAGGNFTEMVLGFGQDSAGNVYVTAVDPAGIGGFAGKVYRLAPAR